MKLYPLKKTVLSLGPNAGQFLKDYSCNTPDAAESAFLNQQGKTIAVFDHLPVDNHHSLLVIEECVKDRLYTHLKGFLHLCDVEMKVEEYRVYYDLDGNTPVSEDAKVITKKPGRLILSHDPLVTQVTDEEFLRFRLEHQIPVQGVDFDDEMILCIDEGRYTSFEKGCYLGQEIVARVHYRGKPPKKLVVSERTDLDASLAQKMTSLSHDRGGGKTHGFVFIPNN